MSSSNNLVLPDNSKSVSSPLNQNSPKIIHYGPIQIRLSRKSAPTLATGRRSKHLILHGDEALKREKRREKNRLAAKKLKEKRQLIEDELNKEIQDLEIEHRDLQNYFTRLLQYKQRIENEIQRLLSDPIDDFLADQEALSAFFHEYIGDHVLDEDPIEALFKLDTN